MNIMRFANPVPAMSKPDVFYNPKDAFMRPYYYGIDHAAKKHLSYVYSYLKETHKTIIATGAIFLSLLVLLFTISRSSKPSNLEGFDMKMPSLLHLYGLWAFYITIAFVSCTYVYKKLGKST